MNLTATSNQFDALPSQITREDGRVVSLTPCITLDEKTREEYSRQLRVESLYKPNVDGRLIYQRGGMKRPRFDIVKDIKTDVSQLSQAANCGINLDDPEDLLGTYFSPKMANGKILSLDEVYRMTGMRYRRVVSLDMAPNLFLRRETQRIMSEMTELEKGPASTARQIFPVENFGSVGETSYVWDQIQEDGPEAIWVDPMEDRPMPTVRMERAEQVRQIRALGFGYSVNWFVLEQLATARANGAPDLRYEARSLKFARDQCLRLENRGIIFGNQQNSILGLLSQKAGTTDPLTPGANVQGIPQVGTPVPLKWLSEVFPGAEGTGEEMYDILTKAYTAILDETEDLEIPDTIVLGSTDFININRKIYYTPNTDSTDSVANVVLKNMAHLGLKAIVCMPELGYRQVRADKLATKDAIMNANDPYVIGNTYAETYAGGLFKNNVMLCFKRDVDKSAIIVGHDLLVRPPLNLGDNQQTTVWLFSGGFLVRKPRSLRIVVAPTEP